MHDVTLGIDHDVLVVSILDLENVLDEGVCCKTLTEFLLSLLELFALYLAFSVLNYKVVEKGGAISSFMNLINAHSIIDDFNEAAIWSSCQNFISLEPQWKLLNLENLIDLRYQLHGKLFLSYIIHGFDNHPNEIP